VSLWTALPAPQGLPCHSIFLIPNSSHPQSNSAPTDPALTSRDSGPVHPMSLKVSHSHPQVTLCQDHCVLREPLFLAWVQLPPHISHLSSTRVISSLSWHPLFLFGASLIIYSGHSPAPDRPQIYADPPQGEALRE
jgi:hypothetical protein